MSDFREAVADRLERAADRMYNSGFLDEERRYRDAAAAIRAGLSLEETQVLERRMLTDPQPGLHRLSALAAQGEYDGLSPDAETTPSDALDEPVLTDIESGALPTATLTGVLDSDSSAQDGWVSTPQSINPYTGAGAGDNDGNAFAGGQSTNPYTGVAPDGDNPNSFTAGQNVNPFTGDQNTESFTGGAASQSPQPTGSSWAAFGYNGPPPPMVASPDLLAQLNTPANPDVASDAVPNYTSTVNAAGAGVVSASTSFVPSVSDIGADTGGSTYVQTFTENGVTYYQFADISGFTYEVRADDDISPSPAPSGTTAPGGPGTASPVVPAPTAPPTATPGPAPTEQNASPAPVPSAPPPDPTQTQQTASPPPDPPAASPDPTQTQPSDPAGSPTTSPSPSAQPGSGTVPFNPMADSPFASWLLYGSDTPIRDFLTNDANLQVAQNVAGGVALGAATIATGGMLLEAAPGILGTGAIGGSSIFGAGTASASSLVTIGTGAAGVLVTHPELPGELEEGVEGTLPAIENTLQSLGPALENTLQEEAETVTPALHHIFPQASNLRPLFEELGIDIDKYAIALDPYIHALLHQGSDPGGWYNEQWVEFFEDHEDATPQQVYDFAVELLNDLGLAGPEYPIVPYK